MIDFSKIPKRREKNPDKGPDEKKASPSDSDASFAPHVSFSEIKHPAKSKKSDSNSPSAKEGKVYKEVLAFAEKILTSAGPPPSVDVSTITASLKSLVDFTESDSQELLRFIFSEDGFEGHYLSFNMVNVSILSLEVGRSLAFRRNELVVLAQAAFFHDVGMRSCLDVADSPRRLSLSEFQLLFTAKIIRF